MIKLGSNSIGKIYLGSNSIGKAYYGSNLVFQKGSSPAPPQQNISYTAAEVLAGGNCGGYIANSGTYDGKWNANSQNKYYGTIIDVRAYKGCRVRFTQVNGDFVRVAALTLPTYTLHATPNFSSEPGYTAMIQHDFTTDTYYEITVPSDTNYLYVYTYADGTNVAPDITIYNVPTYTPLTRNLVVSLFSEHTTISDSGSVLVGEQYPQVTTSYLDALDYALPKELSILATGYPTGVDNYKANVCEYNGNQKFIRRQSYLDVPVSFTLTPSTTYVRIIISQQANGADLEGGYVRFDDDDLQVNGRNNT